MVKQPQKVGVAVSDLWELKGGRPQRARVEVRRAAASLTSRSFLRLDSGPTPAAYASNNPLVDLYPCRDGRWIQLHGGFPHLGEGTSRVIGSEHTQESIAAAVATWDSFELEEALAAAGMCGVVCRTGEEWRETEQGRALLAVPPVLVEKIGEGDPVPRIDYTDAEHRVWRDVWHHLGPLH